MKKIIHRNNRQYRFSFIPVFLFSLFLFLSISFVSIFGAKEEPKNYVIDNAGLLTNTETEKLEEQCRDISREYQISVCIVTTPDFYGDDIKAWQRQYFSEHKMGMGDQQNGIMLAISMAERDWGLVGFGTARTAFTTYGRERIGEIIVDDLSDDDYYKAFSKYVSLTEQFLNEAQKDTPYDNDHKYKEYVPVPFIILGSFVLSLVISCLIVFSWKRSMNTRIYQEGASEYLEKDSFSLSNRSDLFLYHTVSQTRRPKEDHHIHMDSDSSGTSGKF